LQPPHPPTDVRTAVSAVNVMTVLRFNPLLAQADIDPREVLLMRHMDPRARKGRTPYELWRDDRPAFENYQATQSFRNRPRLARPYWASFVGTARGDTMFAGMYRANYQGVGITDMPQPHAEGVDRAGTYDVYDLQER